MFLRPNCNVRLEMIKSEHGRSYVCPECGGKTEGLGVLRNKHGEELINQFWDKMNPDEAFTGCDCPACENPMSEVVHRLNQKHLLKVNALSVWCFVRVDCMTSRKFTLENLP